MEKKMNLFCLPFAGGAKYCYREFCQTIPPQLNMIPLEYPGRGGRTKEPLLTEINLLVEDIYDQIKKYVDLKHYFIYGHSMGGLLSYLLTRKLISNNHRPPAHLFITGTTGPSAISRCEKKRHLLTKEEFFKEIIELKGFPDEVLKVPELLGYYEPILRADFKMSETYVYQEVQPLSIPMTVITGTEEEMQLDDIYLWQKETQFQINFKRMPGNHFFIFDFAAEITKIIAKEIY